MINIESRFTIEGELLDLNKYILIERGNKFGAASKKKKQQKDISVYIQNSNIPKYEDRVIYITYNWYIKNRKKDKDNIAFAKKFIQDALVENGIINNDGWNNIDGFCDNFFLDKEHPRVEVIIKEVNNNG